MHFDDGVIEINTHRTVNTGQHRSAFVQTGQQPRRHGVELADMTEAEFAQERSQRRRGVRAVEHGAHRAVAQQGHVIDAVSTSYHARDQRQDFRPGVGALVGRHRDVLISQAAQPALMSQSGHRDQPGTRHQIGVIKAG